MGQAKQRGTFEERKALAQAARCQSKPFELHGVADATGVTASLLPRRRYVVAPGAMLAVAAAVAMSMGASKR